MGFGVTGYGEKVPIYGAAVSHSKGSHLWGVQGSHLWGKPVSACGIACFDPRLLAKVPIYGAF